MWTPSLTASTWPGSSKASVLWPLISRAGLQRGLQQPLQQQQQPPPPPSDLQQELEQDSLCSHAQPETDIVTVQRQITSRAAADALDQQHCLQHRGC